MGHTGTLDPFASGLLLLCIGSATRLAEYLTDLPKTYRAVLRLGAATDTDDLTGLVVRESDAGRSLSVAAVRDALEAQRGTIEQLPPVYSAKRVGGKRMYAAAREGEALPREPVRVTVHRLEIREIRFPEVEFEVECSSGTYIRAIARDAGDALGVGAHLSALRRTRIGEWSVEAALAAERMDDAAAVAGAIVAPAAAMQGIQQMIVSPADAATIAHGGRIAAPAGIRGDGPIAVCSASGTLLAIAELRDDAVRPRKVFA